MRGAKGNDFLANRYYIETHYQHAAIVI